MNSASGLPDQQKAGPEHVDISATDHSFAAYHVDQLNYHVHVDGRAVLEDLLPGGVVPATTEGDAASGVKHHLSRKSPDIWLHDAVIEEFGRLRELPEFAPANRYDDKNAQLITDRVINAARTPAGVVAVLAFWGDPDTDRWWMPELERLTRITERGGSAWLLNLPLIPASMLFYAAGTAAVHRENYGRLLKLFGLYGESIFVAGAVPLLDLLAANSTAIKLTAAQNYEAVSPTVAEVLHLRPDDVDDAWQLFEILRLATQLMGHHRFDSEVGTYTAANRRGAATAGVDTTAARTAQAARNQVLDALAQCCPVGGLHLRAVEKVFSRGADFRWGSDIAERLADGVSREGSRHPLVGGLGSSGERIEIAVRAVSRAVGEAARRRPAYWVSGAGPAEIWLDR